MSYMKFSTKCAAYLGRIHGLNEEKQIELTYVIEVLTLNIVNIILTLTLGWILGVFWGTLTCLLTIAAFRHNAGGGHSESPWRCGLVTVIIFPFTGFGGRPSQHMGSYLYKFVISGIHFSWLYIDF
ncbi:MAG: accessory gene regulator ArgB-like protein [Bacillota bacterium]|jgi:accessory gene regulator B